MSETKKTFDNVFKVTVIAMRLNRSHPALNRDKFWIMQLFFITIFILFCFGLILNSVLFHDIPSGKYAEACKNTIMIIVDITFAFKIVIMLLYRNSIKTLIRIMEEDYEISETFCDEEKLIVEEYAKKGVNVSYYWLAITVLSSLTFPSKAFISMLVKYLNGEFELVAMFEISYANIIEQHKNEPVIFWIFFLVMLVFDFFAATIYIGFDPLVPVLILHACGQLTVLSRRITNIFNQNSDSKSAKKKLKEIIIKLQEIYSFVDVIKERFPMLYEFNMKTTTFLLPLAVYQIQSSLQQRKMDIEFTSFFAAAICHFYIPCYYSDLLMEKGDSLRQAIYSCRWENHPDPSTRKTILIMLSRTMKPLVICTIFYSICLDTFAEMCHDAYAIFSIMNAAWN